MPGKILVVIGGGAAGFFCAVNAARLHRDLRVVILEKTGKLLSKVRVSGGGRCNVTHACFDIREMSARYPRGGNFVRKAFHEFFTTDTIRWFEERGVKLKTESDGRIFPVTDQSQTIIDSLLHEAEKFGVEIILNATVTGIKKKPGRFRISMQNGSELECSDVCIACGGYPKTEMFDWLEETGHHIEAPVPSLFTFNLPGHPIRSLMGVSVNPVRVRIQGTNLEEEGPVLITHWGLSGPAILKLSAWGARQLATLNWNFSASINWMPAYNQETLHEQLNSFRQGNASRKMKTAHPFRLPQRFWEFILDDVGLAAEKRWADLKNSERSRLVVQLSAMEVPVKGKTTFKEEFVTAGGIRLQEVDPRTMMSRIVDGLYFAGEVLDVDGVTGGFNFQHAWTSGFIAARLGRAVKTSN